jgi:hypothetical protein
MRCLTRTEKKNIRSRSWAAMKWKELRQGWEAEKRWKDKSSENRRGDESRDGMRRDEKSCDQRRAEKRRQDMRLGEMKWDEMTWGQMKMEKDPTLRKDWNDKSRDCCRDAQKPGPHPIGTVLLPLYRHFIACQFWNFRPRLARHL